MIVENPAFSQHQTKSMASLSESAATQACAHMHRCMYASTDKRKPESIIPPAHLQDAAEQRHKRYKELTTEQFNLKTLSAKSSNTVRHFTQ